MKRRRLLAAGAGVLGASVVGTAAGWATGRPVARSTPQPADGMDVAVTHVLEGTDRETPVYELDSGESGPTAVVLGGVHGNEVSGYRAAEEMVGWTIDGGTLVVVPWANVLAIEDHQRAGPDGDLNRQFPAGEEPRTELARALWDLVSGRDPDAVLDLHRSRGILGTHAEWVGQAVYPTPPGMDEAEAVVEAVNDEVVPATMPFHEFLVSGPLTGSAPMLVHKVGAELERPGYVVETTPVLLDLDRQVEWTLEIAGRLLERHGVGRAEA
jgi:hypothetical protein